MALSAWPEEALGLYDGFAVGNSPALQGGR
jgi:hypothetical protein